MQAQTWTQLSTSGGPTTNAGSSLVYDHTSNRMILFGGVLPTGPCCISNNDVWVLVNPNGLGGSATWTKLNAATPNGAPVARAFQSAVYDSGHNLMIVFGGGVAGPCGYFCTMYNDVWVLTNANGVGGTPTWVPLFPSGSAPAPREGHTAIYDSNANRMIVFGGANNGIMDVPNDLWALDDANGLTGTPQWTQLNQSSLVPPPVERFATAYDAANNRMTIFGGCCYWNNDTWLLTNANGLTGTPTWTLLSPSGTRPQIREVHAYGYDPALNELIVFGSGAAGVPYNDTWVLSFANNVIGTPTWANIIPDNQPGSPPLPLPGGDPGVYDPVRARLMLTSLEDNGQGGVTVVPWVLSGLGIAQVIPGNPQTMLGLGGTTNAGGTMAFSDPNHTTLQIEYAEPVSTGNGNYYYQHTDFSIPGRGLPLVFQRSYNALDSYAGPLGANWTHSLNAILTQTASGVANIRFGDGHGETFMLSGTTYVPQIGVQSTFVANVDGTFTLTEKNRTKFIFSAAGRLTSVQDKNGNTVLLGYDTNGNLIQITDSFGRNLTLTYDGSNRITQVADAIGRTVTYAYDGNNNLVSVTDPAGDVTQYAYDSNHHVTAITQPNGSTLLQNVYDSQGRVTSQTNGRGSTWQFAYDTPSTGITTITDARGNKTLHTYDSSLRIVQITDPLGGATSYGYDANNNRTSVTNPNSQTTSFFYDPVGNVTGIANPLGNVVQITYDANNDLLTLTDPKGKTAGFAYDSRGNLTSATDALGHSSTIAYDSYGEPTSRTDANGNTTTFSYDSTGDLVKITNPLGQATALAYDGVGRLLSVTDPNGHTAQATYDMLSRVTNVADPLGHTTQFVYDQVGNLLKVTDANGNSTNYSYDAVNNLATVTDAVGHVTQYAFDTNNNRTGFTNANGKATIYAYDAANRLSTATDPLGFATSYTYDAVGNAVAVADAKKQTNRFTYDELNRLLGISYADGKTVAYTYDADGDRTSMVDAHGTTTYSYDDLDRLLTVTNPGGKTVAYAYDAVGERTGLTYPDGKTVGYQYDLSGRLLAVTDWLSRQTRYSYDPAGNVTKIAYPTGAGVNFAYDNANRLASVIDLSAKATISRIVYTLDATGNRVGVNLDGIPQTFGYDPLNELISAQVGPLGTRWTYDAVGNRLSQKTPLGTTLYAYDVADRLLSAGQTTFSYDADGNMVSKSIGKAKLNYSYDAANRLSAAVGFGVNSSFAYDGDGNRIAQNTALGNYTYINDTAAGLPVVLNEQGPEGNITFGYGLNLIESASSSFNYFYHYDGLGSVMALTDASGRLASAYASDAWGNDVSLGSVGLKNKFQFTGQAHDPGTGLYFLRARYYDAGIGRFLTTDSIWGLSTWPGMSNKYVYALNDPVRLVDPSGHTALSWLGSIAGGAFNLLTFNQNSFQPAEEKKAAYEQCIANLECSNDGSLEESWNQSVAKVAVESGKQGLTTEIGIAFSPVLAGVAIPASVQWIFDLQAVSGDLTTLINEIIQGTFSIPTAQASSK